VTPPELYDATDDPRLANGFGNYTNYRLRILIVADGARPLPLPTQRCLNRRAGAGAGHRSAATMTDGLT
jgi:hypothetical protein